MYDYINKYKLCKKHIFIYENKYVFVINDSEIYYIDEDLYSDLDILAKYEDSYNQSLLDNLTNSPNELSNYFDEILSYINKEKINKEQYIGIISDSDIYNAMLICFKDKNFLKLVHIDIASLKLIDTINLDFCIALSKFESSGLFNKINNVLLKKNIPWLRCIINLSNVEVGPVFVPGSTCCYKCYETRKISNVNDSNGYIETLKIFDSIYNQYQYELSNSLIKLASNLCVSETLNYLEGTPICIEKEHIFDLKHFDIHKNFIQKVPNCECALLDID